MTTLPLGLDALGMHRSFDTDALAAAFPFTGGLGSGDGVLYGTTTSGSGILFWDRFTQDNHNSVILARSGAGKSYLAKLEALRSSTAASRSSSSTQRTSTPALRAPSAAPTCTSAPPR